jgi:hypothetical protein
MKLTRGLTRKHRYQTCLRDQNIVGVSSYSPYATLQNCKFLRMISTKSYGTHCSYNTFQQTHSKLTGYKFRFGPQSRSETNSDSLRRRQSNCWLTTGCLGGQPGGAKSGCWRPNSDPYLPPLPPYGASRVTPRILLRASIELLWVLSHA